MKYRTLLFDLDGTLLDTTELILSSFDYALDIHAPGRYTRADVMEQMGKPLVTQMELFVPDNVAGAIQTYREFNLGRHDEFVRSFPHAVEVLGTLHADGYQLGVVTSKIRLTTERGLAYCGLQPFFQTVVTSEDVQKPKPDGEPVLQAMAALGADAAETLMIGDTPFDLLAGQAAGVKTVAVGWTMHGIEALLPYRPDYIIDDLHDLLPLVRGS